MAEQAATFPEPALTETGEADYKSSHTAALEKESGAFTAATTIIG